MADTEILAAICEIRDLVRLIAEPQIAARDKKLRDEFVRVVGKSAIRRKAALAMDGTRTQGEIIKQSGMNQGNLSRMIKELAKGQLLNGDPKKPKLAFPIPANFFDQTGE